MKQIVLIALIALLQTIPPVPGKATDNASQIRKSRQDKAAADQTPTDKAMPSTNLANPAINQQTGPAQTSTNEDKTQTVRVAPVDIHKDWTDYLYILASLLLTLITLGIAVFAAIQARAAKKSADNDERSIKLTERADVLLEAAGIKSTDSDGFDGHSRIVLRFKNFGRTRANNVAIEIELTVPDTPEGIIPKIPKIVMGAGEDQLLTFRSFRETLTEATFRNICEGSVVLGFKGTVSYDDVFDQHHVTRCSGEFSVKLRAFMKVQNEDEQQNPT